MLFKPLTLSLMVNYASDTEMLDYVCNEGERDRVHYVEGRQGAKVSVKVLRKYAGTYEAKQGGKLTMQLGNDGQLYVGAFPLVAQSEMRFNGPTQISRES